MGHYDDIRDEYDAERRKVARDDFKLEVLEGRWHTLIEAAKVGGARDVVISVENFSLMLEIIREVAWQDERLKSMAERRRQENEDYIWRRVEERRRTQGLK